MISSKNFYLFAAFEHYVNQGIQILRFLWFLTYFRKDGIPTDLLPEF
jgi:hypothetical protein